MAFVFVVLLFPSNRLSGLCMCCAKAFSFLYRVATNAAKVLEEKGMIKCLHGIISWLEMGK